MPEVWFPDSKEPFRPLNPWGRAMPKVPQRSKPQLYQVVVRSRKLGREMPVGPRSERKLVDHLFEMIMRGIQLGTERDWSAPHIVAVKSEHSNPSGLTLGDLLKSEVPCR